MAGKDFKPIFTITNRITAGLTASRDDIGSPFPKYTKTPENE